MTALGDIVKLIAAAAFLAFVLWGFLIGDEVECWLKGADYMEARGASCDLGH